MQLHFSSPAFAQGQAIPPPHTCDGDNHSPALAWENPPPGTQSFALIMDDPDAPSGLWVHWVLYDLPAGLNGLPADLPKTPSLENGAKQGACWGVNHFDRIGYQGPCPPPGKPHHYYFVLYALDRPLHLPAKKTAAEIRAAMQGHILAEAALVGTYQR
jgi:Raf kinase inhibitor-like YbhB/YbcL family protein